MVMLLLLLVYCLQMWSVSTCLASDQLGKDTIYTFPFSVEKVVAYTALVYWIRLSCHRD
jgi:hypothetical protein